MEVNYPRIEFKMTWLHRQGIYNMQSTFYSMYMYIMYKVTCKGVRRRGFLSRLPGLCPVELEGLLVPFSSGILSPSYTQYI